MDRTRWDAVWFSCEGGLDTASALLPGFFDIVDLDEGTCGRRLAVSGVIEASVDRLKLSRSHMSFTYPYVMDGCYGFRTVTAVLKKYVQSGSSI